MDRSMLEPRRAPKHEQGQHQHQHQQGEDGRRGGKCLHMSQIGRCPRRT